MQGVRSGARWGRCCGSSCCGGSISLSSCFKCSPCCGRTSTGNEVEEVATSAGGVEDSKGRRGGFSFKACFKRNKAGLEDEEAQHEPPQGPGGAAEVEETQVKEAPTTAKEGAVAPKPSNPGGGAGDPPKGEQRNWWGTAPNSSSTGSSLLPALARIGYYLALMLFFVGIISLLFFLPFLRYKTKYEVVNVEKE